MHVTANSVSSCFCQTTDWSWGQFPRFTIFQIRKFRLWFINFHRDIFEWVEWSVNIHTYTYVIKSRSTSRGIPIGGSPWSFPTLPHTTTRRSKYLTWSDWFRSIPFLLPSSHNRGIQSKLSPFPRLSPPTIWSWEQTASLLKGDTVATPRTPTTVDSTRFSKKRKNYDNYFSPRQFMSAGTLSSLREKGCFPFSVAPKSYHCCWFSFPHSTSPKPSQVTILLMHRCLLN